MSKLEFPRSDGDAQRLPEERLDAEPDENGKIDTLERLPLDAPVSKHWRKKIGSDVAHALGLERKYSICVHLTFIHLLIHLLP